MSLGLLGLKIVAKCGMGFCDYLMRLWLSFLFDQNDFLAKINKVFKGMEIVGQIVRNRHASMHRDTLYSLVEQGSSTGLRFLNFFISLSDIAKQEVVQSIEIHLYEHPSLTDKEVHIKLWLSIKLAV